MKNLILTLLLFYSTATASINTINSLPYTANQNGTDYSDTLVLNGTNLSSTTGGITFTGDNIVLMLVDDTLTFGTNGTDDNFGLRFGGHHIKVIGGTILHLPSTGTPSIDTTAESNIPIHFYTTCSTIYIENTDLTVRGFESHGVRREFGVNSRNVEINGGTWTSEVTGYVSRCNFGGAICKLSGNYPSIADTDYHFKIHDVTITKSPHAGINIGGRSEVYDCDITIDDRNDFYTMDDYPTANACWSATNAAAILCQELLVGSSIHDNIIRADTNYGGCDIGIYFDESVGADTSYILIYNNDILIHQGWDNHYGWLNAKGIKSRRANKYVNVYNNPIVVQAGDSTRPAYGGDAVGVEFYSYRDEGKDPDSFVVYENNTITVVALDSNFSECVGAKFAASLRHDTTTHKFYEAGNRFRNNTITTSSGAFVFGASAANNGQCYDVVVDSNTISFDATDFGNDKYMYEIGYNDISLRNLARDNIYSGETADSMTIFAGYHFINTAAERDWSYEKTVNAKVVGTNDLPVPGATIVFSNNYNDTILITSTDVGGLADALMRYYHVWAIATGNDSTNYNPILIEVSKDGQTYDTTLTINWQTPLVEIPLNVLGEEGAIGGNTTYSGNMTLQ